MSCQPIVFPPCPVPVCPEQIVYASENGNLNGIGILDSNTSSLGTFRGVVGDGTYISTTLDAGNKSVVVSLIAAAIPAAIPQATETVSGKGEVATQAETNAGVSDVAFLTPLKLQNRVASTTGKGIIEIASLGEVNALADASLAVTPYTFGQHLLTRKFTTTWANAAARAAATPEFDGQIGVQLDTELVYTATGLAVGNWQQTFIQANTTTVFTGVTAFDIPNATTFVLRTDGTDVLVVIDYSVRIQSACTLRMENGSFFDFSTTARLQINSVTVPANSVPITSSTAGQMASKLIADFISTSNQQTGWGTPTGVLTRTAFDASTVTLPQLGERVAALITDLKAKLLPAT